MKLIRSCLLVAGTVILLASAACGSGSVDEVYIGEMNTLMSQHLETYTNVSDELDRLQDELRNSPNVASARETMVEFQVVMERTEEQFEDLLNQWSTLEPPEVARTFHARAFEMMQLRLNAVRYTLLVADLLIATGDFDSATAQQAADLFDESDRVYLDVLAEGRKVDKVLFK